MSFDMVKSKFPFPSMIEALPRHWETYTGRGKSIIVDLIKECKLRDMLEIGVYLGGSVDFFLNVERELRIVASDPWGSGWVGTHAKTLRYNERYLLDLSDESAALLDDADSFFGVVVNGLQRFRDRLILVRGRFEDTGRELKALGYAPDLIFLDATKQLDLLETAFEIFPEAILTGDDYRWRDPEGKTVMARNLDIFAEKHGMRIDSYLDSWVLHPD